jgi:uncharacterized membrane protein YjjB (DUF3815 family)
MFTSGRVESTRALVRLRPVALPVEHGGWGLLFEPLVLGLLLAPSLPGLYLSLAAIGAFLARHPLKLTIADWRRHRRSARTPLAERFAILYFCIATLSLAIAIKTGGTQFLVPLLLAAPVAFVQLFYDSLGRSRALIAELAGSISIGAVSSAIAIAGAAPRTLAFALWVILAMRNVPTILYLRVRLRLLHRKPASPRLVIIAHVLALLVVIGLAQAEVAPWLAVVALAILLGRAVFGFSNFDNPMTAKKLGLRELGFGAMTVFTVVLGHMLGW